MGEIAEPLPASRTISGKCRTRALVFVHCHVTLEHAGRKSGEDLRRDRHYAFVALHFGDWTARVVGDPMRPELMTTDLGLERLWNRLATRAGVELMLIALAVGSIAKVPGGER